MNTEQPQGAATLEELLPEPAHQPGPPATHEERVERRKARFSRMLDFIAKECDEEAFIGFIDDLIKARIFYLADRGATEAS